MKHDNLVQKAILALGGATKAAIQLKVSNSTIYKWINAGRVSDIDKAKQLASLANMKLEEVRA